jgi:ferrous iron transport protein B
VATAPARTEAPTLTVALAGNPNSGKTSLFNQLTGSRQHVGNWPGVTVERKEGVCQLEGPRAAIVDLPGTYSLTANSPDERVARDFVLHGGPDVVIAVVDAANLERNLYLVVQLIELGAPLVMALNMCDMAEGRGFAIDVGKLAELLDVPVVSTCAVRGLGVGRLWEEAQRIAREGRRPRPLRYGRQVDEAIESVTQALEPLPELTGEHPTRWLAISLLIGDETHLPGSGGTDPVLQHALSVARSSARHLEEVTGDTAEAAIISGRYGAIAGLYHESVVEPEDVHLTPSDRLDHVFLHRTWGLPILFVALAIAFQLTFWLGGFPSEWLRAACVWLGIRVGGLLPAGPPRSLVVDGIIGGVGGVLAFLPQIAILFAVVAFLEDSGYMARAAFLMDRLMHRMGLHGKAFIPMVMGFGCNVPAIMATRTLESERDRLLTILITPLMSCSARLPVYALLAGALFGRQAGWVFLSLYVLGIALAAAMARIFRCRVLPGEEEPFFLELPPYHRPTAKGIIIHTWERAKLFLQKASTVILAGSVIMWFLSAFPWGVEIAGEHSYAGQLGKLLAPLVAPLGFSWREAMALMFGFVAKEIVVATFGVLYGLGKSPEAGELGRLLAAGPLTPLSGYAFMAFTLIYTPCLATIAAIRRETNSWKWALFAVGYLLLLAWLVAFVIYQGGRLLGLG